MAKRRTVQIRRKTAQSDIQGSLNLDGSGKAGLKTGIGLLDHALAEFAFHGYFDLTVRCRPKRKAERHHANDDVAVALGEAFRNALGNQRGIRRYGCVFVPVNETEVRVDVEIGSRYFFSGIRRSEVMPVTGQPHEDASYSYRELKDFLGGFARSIGMSLHVSVLYPGQDLRHEAEAIFKALGRALDEATHVDPRRRQTAPASEALGS
jgi:imidazoleglycerol-phosphate dehydratase